MASLDTTALLDLLRRPNHLQRAAVVAAIRAARERGETIVTTRFNVAELQMGIHLSDDPIAELERVEAALMGVAAVLDFDEPSADVFAFNAARLRRRGTPVSDMDLLIGSVSLAHGHRVLTRNASHFRRIEGLDVEDYGALG